MITVLGSHGEIQCDPVSGVTACPETAQAIQTYGNIIRFDLDEWREHYGQDPAGIIDICDIGYWTDDLAYQPPSKEHRRMISDGWGVLAIPASVAPTFHRLFRRPQQ